jgi:hypothetical protein
MNTEFALILLTLIRIALPASLLLMIGTWYEQGQKSGKGRG